MMRRIQFDQPGLYHFDRLTALGEDTEIIGCPGAVMDFTGASYDGNPCLRVGGTADWTGASLPQDVASGATVVCLGEYAGSFMAGDVLMLSSMQKCAEEGDVTKPWFLAPMPGACQGELAAVVDHGEGFVVLAEPLRRGGSAEWYRAYRVRPVKVTIRNVTIAGTGVAWLADLTDCYLDLWNVRFIGGEERSLQLTRTLGGTPSLVTTAGSFSQRALDLWGTCYGLSLAGCRGLRASLFSMLDGKHAVSFGGGPTPCEDSLLIQPFVASRPLPGRPDVMAVQFHANTLDCGLDGGAVVGGVGSANPTNTVRNTTVVNRDGYPLYHDFAVGGDGGAVANTAFVCDPGSPWYAWLGVSSPGVAVGQFDVERAQTHGGVFGLNVGAVANPDWVEKLHVDGAFLGSTAYGLQIQGTRADRLDLGTIAAPSGVYIEQIAIDEPGGGG